MVSNGDSDVASLLRAGLSVASLVLRFPSISEGMSWIRTGACAIPASSADMRITLRASDLPTSSRVNGASTHPLSSALHNVPVSVRLRDYTDRRGQGRLCQGSNVQSRSVSVRAMLGNGPYVLPPRTSACPYRANRGATPEQIQNDTPSRQGKCISYEQRLGVLRHLRM